jgi:hypothetical protein
MVSSEVLRTKASPYCDARQHARSQFLTIVECEDEILPPFAS